MNSKINDNSNFLGRAVRGIAVVCTGGLLTIIVIVTIIVSIIVIAIVIFFIVTIIVMERHRHYVTMSS